LTAVIRPRRSTFEGKAYGSGTKYIVRFKSKGRDDEIVLIYARDYEVKKFRTFQLTEQSLTSRDALEAFLLEEAISGRVHRTDVDVFDTEQWLAEVYRSEPSEAFGAAPRNWFAYHIVGWAVTKWDDFQIWRENRTILRKHPDRH
jgi:hypothetical protein